MKVRIEQVERYELFIDDVSIGEFAEGESWEGMTPYTNSEGAKVIAGERTNRHLPGFERFCDSRDEREIVKISPSLVPVKSA